MDEFTTLVLVFLLCFFVFLLGVEERVSDISNAGNTNAIANWVGWHGTKRENASKHIIKWILQGNTWRK